MPARKPLEKKKKKKAKSSGDTFTSSLSSSSSRSLNETEEDGGKAASGSKEEDEGKKGKAAFSSTMGKKKQKSQQKFFFASSSFCKDPLSLSRNTTGKGGEGGGGGGGGGRSSLSTEREKEEFVDFLLSKQSPEEEGEEEEDDGDGFTLQCPMQVVREAVREYPGVKLNRELLEDAEAALAFFGGGREGGGSFNIDEDGDGEGLNSSSSSTHVLRVRHNFLMLEDFEEMVEESSGARTVLLTIPSSSISSKEEDVATKKTVFLNALKISEQNREIGEREEKARRDDLLEAKKKLVSQANTAAAAKGKTSSSGGVGKKKTGTKGGGGAAVTKRKKEDDAGDLKIGGKDKEEGVEKEENIDEILFDDNDILSGSCAATRRFNTGKFQLEQSKKSHGAVADEKVFKFLREFKKEIYDSYRLQSLVEKMDLSSDNDSVDDIVLKREDRENVLQCIRIWIKMRVMVVSARLALIEREKFLKDCEAMTKFASEYRKDTKNMTSALASSAALSDQTTTTVIAPLKTKAADARTAKTILKEIPTYSIANRSLSSWSILFNEDDEALLDNGCVERSDDIDDDIDDYVDDGVDDDVQHVLTIEEQLENEIETYEQDQKFHQLIMKDYFSHVTPDGREFREVTAKLEKTLEKVLCSPTLRTKTLHDRDRLLASTKWSADQTMVFDDLVLLCDNAHFPSNEKACKAADDINRHVLYRAGSVLKKAFEILSSFVEKDLLDSEFKKSASQLFSSTLEQTYRHQFGNILNDILDPYDSLPDYTGETSKLLMFVRVRVTRAMEIDSALRERAHQTVISACLEQMLSGIFDEFSRQKTEKFIEQLLFEEETEEKEKKKAKAAKASSSSSSKKKKSNKTVKETPVPSFSEKRDKVSDKEEDEEVEKEDEEEEKKEEVTPALPHVAPTIAARDEGGCMEEENLEAWQEVKKARSAKSSPSSVIVAPKDLVVSKVKVSPVKKIPTAKQQQQQQQQQERRKELSSSPPLPKSPPPKEVVTAAVEKKREATRRALFVDKLKKNEMAPAPVVLVEEKTSEENKEGDEGQEANEGKKEETNADADDKEENENAYVVRNVSDIEQSFCAASNPPPIQQQHYQHHHHQHYQPPLPQMPTPQMVDGQRVVFVPMIIPDSGSMSHPMPFGMHHHHSMVPPLPPPMPQLPDTSEAVAAMYNKFYQDFVMQQQQYAQPPPPPSKSSSSNIGGGANEATSDTASTSSDEFSSAAAVKFSSTPSSPPLPKTPPPKGQQQMVVKHHHKSTSSSSSPSMSPSASSSSIRIPSPRRIDPARISSSAFPKPRRSSREYKRDNYHHHHRGNNTIDHNTNLKREEDFPELSSSITKDKNTKASNVMSLAKSSKSWAEAQMELKGTSLPSLTSSPVKPPSPPQRHHQVQRQVA